MSLLDNRALKAVLGRCQIQYADVDQERREQYATLIVRIVRDGDAAPGGS